jgi:HD-like signal output (HDOD) protein
MHDSDDESLVEAILASGVKIPPMPAILMEVLALERDEDAGPRQYAALIGRDPALSGGVFRVAGSPVMGLRTKVDSLEKAITVLGLRTTLAVVRSEGLRDALHDPESAAVMNLLWQRMNAVADLVLASVRTARMRGVREDLAFQAGIFHDCGVAVLCRRDHGYAKAVLEAKGWPDLTTLDAAHRTSHTMVGQMVARNWQLPRDVVMAIRHHHDADIDALPEAARNLIVLIQFARHVLATRAGTADAEWEGTWRARAEALFEVYGQDPAALEIELGTLL